jgi:DNA-binding IclR family transcriptional regulator
MGCINADGSLSPVALQVLRALAASTEPVTGDVVARVTGLPVYRARASLRELQSAGLVVLDNGAPRLSALGQARLDAVASRRSLSAI